VKRRGGRRLDAKGRSTKPGRFLQLTHFMLESAAWKSLDAVERALCVEVAQRWTGFNNGHIGLGVRQAGKALHVKPQTVGRAFATLQERGFLALQRDSTFDQKRLAREWRVTFFPMGDCRAPSSPPSNDFMRWRPPPGEQNPEPFGGTPSAVSEHDDGTNRAARPIQCPQTALKPRVIALHRAVWGHTSSYQDREVA
jgi:hypothetical protein